MRKRASGHLKCKQLHDNEMQFVILYWKKILKNNETGTNYKLDKSMSMLCKSNYSVVMWDAGNGEIENYSVARTYRKKG